MKYGAIKGVRFFIFDCDGVLFDSRRANLEYYNKICTLAGRPPITRHEFAYVHMHTAEESVRYLFRDYPDLLSHALGITKAVSYGEFMRYMKFDPVLPLVLDELKRLGINMAISTNRSTTMPLIMKIFRLDRWFDYICCALDVERPKPHPEGVYKIMRFFGASPRECIYIGDSVVDQEVSKRASIPLVAYRNPALNARFHVKHFLDLLRIARSIV